MSIKNVRVPHQKQVVKRLQHGHQWSLNIYQLLLIHPRQQLQLTMLAPE